MSFQDNQVAEQQEIVKRRAGRPRREAVPTALATGPSRPKSKYDPDARYRATLHTYEGGHQGPVPLTIVTEHGTQRALLIPEVPVTVLGNLLNESLEHAVIDERGPSLEQNLAAIGHGEDTIRPQYDADGRIMTRRGRQTGQVRRRFQVEVEAV